MISEDEIIFTAHPKSAKDVTKNSENWRNYHKELFSKSLVDRINSNATRQEADQTIKLADSVTNRNQYHSTKLLKERLSDVNFWEKSLEKEISSLTLVINSLSYEKRLLQNVLMNTEHSLQIAMSNIEARESRRFIDNFLDLVELNLGKEEKTITEIQELLKKTIREFDSQIKNMKEIKEKLERDWSDKSEAAFMDATCGKLKNSNTNKQFYHGVAHYLENMSTPEVWIQHVHDLLAQAERERMTSLDLINLAGKMRNDMAHDLIEHSHRVCAAFNENIENFRSTKRELTKQLQETVDELTKQEINVARLKQAILMKNDPMQVAQTRLHTREFRENVELCKDEAAINLVHEVDTLDHCLDHLENELARAENNVKVLQDRQLALEKEILFRTETLQIDEQQCLPVRSMQMDAVQLEGYL